MNRSERQQVVRIRSDIAESIGARFGSLESAVRLIRMNIEANAPDQGGDAAAALELVERQLAAIACDLDVDAWAK